MSIKRFGKLLLLLLIAPSFALAEELIPYGDWVFKNKADYKSAMTTNSDRQELGFICKEFCLIYFSPIDKCDTQNPKGYLLTSSKEVYRLDINCVVHDSVHFLVLKDFNEIKRIIESNNIIYFFMDSETKYSKVSIFSLIGANDAINKLFSYAPKL